MSDKVLLRRLTIAKSMLCGVYPSLRGTFAGDELKVAIYHLDYVFTFFGGKKYLVKPLNNL